MAASPQEGLKIPDRHIRDSSLFRWNSSSEKAALSWEKGHHRLERRRIARAAVDPESIGLGGCWQVLAVRRERVPLGASPDPASVETGYYATNLSHRQYPDQELLKIIRDHWAAIENGSHYRRDHTFGEDACPTSKRGAVQVLAALRNLAIALYELEQERGHTQVNEFKSWCRQMTASTALKLVLHT